MKFRNTLFALIAAISARCTSSTTAPIRQNAQIPKESNAQTEDPRGDDVAQVKFSTLLDFTGAGTWTNRIWINFDESTIKRAQSFIVEQASLEQVVVPVFSVTSLGKGNEAIDAEKTKKEIMSALATMYQGLDVSFITSMPTSGGFTSIHIGGKDFRGKRALGVAPLDIDNFSGKDIGFVFSEELDTKRPRSENIHVLINSIAHEIGHCLGAEHINNKRTIMNPIVDVDNKMFGKGQLVSRKGEQDSRELIKTNVGPVVDADLDDLPELKNLAIYTQENIGQVTVYTKENLTANPDLNLGRFEYSWKLGKFDAKGPSVRVKKEHFASEVEISVKHVKSGNSKSFTLPMPAFP
jgi:hypothetical protein